MNDITFSSSLFVQRSLGEVESSLPLSVYLILPFPRFKVCHLYRLCFGAECRRYSHQRTFMTLGFNKSISMVVVVVAAPFKMCEEPCVVVNKFFNGQAAIFCGMF